MMPTREALIDAINHEFADYPEGLSFVTALDGGVLPPRQVATLAADAVLALLVTEETDDDMTVAEFDRRFAAGTPVSISKKPLREALDDWPEPEGSPGEVLERAAQERFGGTPVSVQRFCSLRSYCRMADGHEGECQP